MTTLDIGSPIPDFLLPATDEQSLGPQLFRGKYIVLYFYPRDDTPGCTQEAQDFRDLYDDFIEKNAVILGISRDTVRKHENFKKKYDIPFPLLADTEETVCQMFAVMKDKVMFGKPARGIERSTFLINPEGIICAVWRKVKVNEHAKIVLQAISK